MAGFEPTQSTLLSSHGIKPPVHRGGDRLWPYDCGCAWHEYTPDALYHVLFGTAFVTPSLFRDSNAVTSTVRKRSFSGATTGGRFGGIGNDADFVQVKPKGGCGGSETVLAVTSMKPRVISFM